MRNYLYHVIYFASLIFATSVASANISVTLSASEDSMLATHSNLGSGSVPQGSKTTFNAISIYSMLPSPGNYTLPVLKWDMSSYAGKTVVSGNAYVSMRINTNWYYDRNGKYGTGIPYMDLSVHKILVPWTESSVTYNNFGGDTGLQSDEYGASICSVRLYDLQKWGEWITWTIPGSMVQQWIDDPTNNYGLLFKPNGYNRPEFNFFSSESSTPPALSFEIVPEPATLSLLSIGGILLRRRK